MVTLVERLTGSAPIRAASGNCSAIRLHYRLQRPARSATAHENGVVGACYKPKRTAAMP